MKVLITGGSGLVGSNFEGINTPHELVLVSSRDYDLTNESAIIKMFEKHKPSGLIHLAAKVGGVWANTEYVADFFYQNMMMNTMLLHHAARFGITKAVSLLSTCVYPSDNIKWPLTEDQIHAGPPHQSNFGYAHAKRMLDVQSQAYRQQYGCNFVTAVPNNLYGKYDNFDKKNSHVIPAIMRKIWEAKLSGDQPVFWGDGTPKREFTYAPDLAKILLMVLEHYNDPEPLNIGYGRNISIMYLVEKISTYLEYEGPISWDVTMPSGQHKKPSSTQKWSHLQLAGSMPEFNEYTDIEDGLKETCDWFKEAYPQVRGVTIK